MLADMTGFQESDVALLAAKETALLLRRCQSHDQPRAILLAGQPGAGKTELSAMMITQLDGDAAFINGDDYRRYHPNYRKLYADYGSDCARLTQFFSSEVTERLIGTLSDHRLNLVIEGTGRTVDVPHATAEMLTAKGYTVEMAVIAVRPEVSLTSTLIRFYRMNEGGTIPRATAVEAHDKVVTALPDNLDALLALPCISRIRIWDRELSLLFDSDADAGRPSGILRGYWNRPWTSGELDEARGQLELLRQKETATDLGQGAAIDVLARRIGHASRTVENEPPALMDLF